MSKKIVNIEIDEEFLNLIDKARTLDQRSRSSFIRKAVIEYAQKILEENGKNEREERKK